MFKATCKMLRIPKAIEQIWARQRLLPWFHEVITSWIYEHTKRHMSRNTEAYQSFQMNIGPGDYKRVLLRHRNAVTTAVNQVVVLSCTKESEKRKVLRADLQRNVSRAYTIVSARNGSRK